MGEARRRGIVWGAVAWIFAAVTPLTAGAWAEEASPRSGSVGLSDVLHQRGSVTMDLVHNPPRLLGVGTDLQAAGGALTGLLRGERYDVKIADGRAQGSGPRGAIDVTIEKDGDAIAIRGKWNGEKIDLTLSAQEIRGRVVKPVAAGARGVESCRYDLDVRKEDSLSGTQRCLGGPEPVRFSVTAPELLLQPESALILAAYLAAPPPLHVD